MQNARMLGYHVEYLAQRRGLTTRNIAQIMGCSDIQARRFLKGFAYASFGQIEALAAALQASVQCLLNGDSICLEDKFSESKDREVILNIIHDYVDVVDAANAAEGESVK